MCTDPDAFWMPFTSNRQFKQAPRRVKAIQDQAAELDGATTGMDKVFFTPSASKAMGTMLKRAV
ncbi:MAG: hypothetical protein IPI03_14275 [Rubrivivax sp.]|nr:hypothetical protein [Rubrivivax sp.]MBK7262963.1 hypothetical protein [Rubrivivax sp.]MBK8529135.1 hypothetical protein [Rubrivivax sp.]